MLYRAYIGSSSKWLTENYNQQEDFYRINVVISWETNEKSALKKLSNELGKKSLDFVLTLSPILVSSKKKSWGFYDAVWGQFHTDALNHGCPDWKHTIGAV